MSADNLMMQSVNITIIGMLVVFVFLTIMIGIMKVLTTSIWWPIQHSH